MQRGWPDADLEKLASGNFVRAFEAVEKARRPAA
jgi:microsomal dipeptidase-like Zn-dependent dipeptidase